MAYIAYLTHPFQAYRKNHDGHKTDKQESPFLEPVFGYFQVIIHMKTYLWVLYSTVCQ